MYILSLSKSLYGHVSHIHMLTAMWSKVLTDILIYILLAC